MAGPAALNDYTFRYRPSKEKFPIVVSQDCDNKEAREAASMFGDEIQYVKVGKL